MEHTQQPSKHTHTSIYYVLKYRKARNRIVRTTMCALSIFPGNARNTSRVAETMSRRTTCRVTSGRERNARERPESGTCLGSQTECTHTHTHATLALTQYWYGLLWTKSGDSIHRRRASLAKTARLDDGQICVCPICMKNRNVRSFPSFLGRDVSQLEFPPGAIALWRSLPPG